MRKAYLILVLLVGAMLAAPWSLELTLSTLGEEKEITIGLEADALDGYDGPDGYDENIPLAPPSGPYAFSAMDDPDWPFMTMLSTDIRADDELEKVWQLELRRGGVPQDISWDRYSLPTGAGRFYLGFAYPGLEIDDWYDMTASSTETFMPGQVVYVRFVPISGGESTPPYIAELSPEDGAVDIATNRPLIVEVRDNETSVALSSVIFTVNGTDVFGAAEITPVTGGYRFEYIPGAMWTPEADYEVYFYAEDTGTEPLSVEFTSTFATGPAMLPADWELPFEVWTVSDGDSIAFDLSIGGAASAGDGFDLGYDVIFPIAVPGVPYAFFPLSDPDFPYYEMLTRDIRSTYEDEIVWEVALENPGYPNGVRWDRLALPEDKEFYIAAAYPPMTPEEDDWRDMSTSSSFTMMPAQRVFIRTVGGSDVLPPYLVSVDPENGAVSVPGATDLTFIVADEGTGIDESTIALTVEGVDVTDLLSISLEGPMVTIVYSPEEPFPASETIDWNLTLSDLASTPNEMDITGHFTTSYLMEPEFMAGIIVTTTPVEDEPYDTELFFGLDPEATDGFDIGLDLQSPPPPPGFMTNAYFQIDDEIASELKRDIRGTDSPAVRWQLYLGNIDITRASYLAHWDVDELDREGNFEIAFSTFGVEPLTWADMNEVEELSFSIPGYIHIRYSLGALYEIYGVVTNTEGEPIVGADVILEDMPGYVAVTDSLGYYSIIDVPAGDYEIAARAPGYDSFFDEITIEGHTVFDIEMEPTTYTLSGFIDGPAELEGTIVTLGDFATETDDAGLYEITAPAGTYDLNITRTGFYPVLIEDFELIDDTVYNDTLEPSGSVVTVHVDLEDYPLDTLGGTHVTLGEYEAYTDAAGDAVFTGIETGEYTLTIERDWYLMIDGIVIVEEMTHTFDYELTKIRVDVSGTVYSDLGGVIADAVVEFDDLATTTDHLGNYLIEDVKMGDRIVSASAEGFSTFNEVVTVNEHDFVYDITLEWGGSTDFNPPQNLEIISGMHDRIAFRWDPPAPTGQTLTGYKIYNYRVVGDDVVVGEVPPYSTCCIVREGTGGFYYATAVYGDNESDGTDIDTGFPNDDATDPDILILDFDDGARLAGSSDEEDYINSLAAFYREVCDITSQNDGLGEFDPLEYKLVWIITGIDDDLNEILSADDLQTLRSYMAGGGSIFWEGADAGYDYDVDEGTPEKEFFDLFGAEYVDDGRSRTAGNVEDLRGSRSFFEQGPVQIDYRYRETGDTRLDEFNTTFGRLIMRSQEDPAPEISRIRMIAAEEDNYRSVISSVYIGSMIDGDEGTNTRYNVMAWLLNYLYYLEGDDRYDDVEESIVTMPTHLSHVSAYPNPFNASSNIEFAVGTSGSAKLTVQDLTGRTVKTLYSGNIEKGTYVTRFDCTTATGEAMATGVYIVVLENEGDIATESILLVK